MLIEFSVSLGQNRSERTASALKGVGIAMSARVLLRTQGRVEGCGLDVLRADVFPAKHFNFRSALRIDRTAGAFAVRTDPSFRTFNFGRVLPSTAFRQVVFPVTLSTRFFYPVSRSDNISASLDDLSQPRRLNTAQTTWIFRKKSSTRSSITSFSISQPSNLHHWSGSLGPTAHVADSSTTSQSAPSADWNSGHYPSPQTLGGSRHIHASSSSPFRVHEGVKSAGDEVESDVFFCLGNALWGMIYRFVSFLEYPRGKTGKNLWANSYPFHVNDFGTSNSADSTKDSSALLPPTLTS